MDLRKNKTGGFSRRAFLGKVSLGSLALGLGGSPYVAWAASSVGRQKTAELLIDANRVIGEFGPFWANIKFHPTEYLSTEWGRDLVRLLKESGAAQQYMRLYNQPEDAVVGNVNGKIQYKWDHFDEKADLLLKYGIKPIVSFFSMPVELAAQPDMGKKRPFLDGKYVCYSPPKDYVLWQELCADFTKHVLERFGEQEVKQWYFIGWNEPDLSSFWHNADMESYYKLYDYFAAGVKSVTKSVRIGGPAVSSGNIYQHPDIYRNFLKHVTAGENAATGGIGSPIDFLPIHTYGGHGGGGSSQYPHPSVDYIMEQQLRLASIRNEFPELAETPMFVTEWGASSSGSRGMDKQPMAEVRNTQYAPAFLTAMVARHLELKSSDDDPNIEGLMLCISGYEKEQTRDFEGKRTLHTRNGFHKPLLNGYKLLAKLGRNLVFVGTHPKNPNLHIIASREDHKRLTIMATNYQASAVYNEGPSATINLEIRSLWPKGTEVEQRHWRIDETHSNAYSVYRKIGSPLKPSFDDQKKVIESMELSRVERPLHTTLGKKISLEFDLPCNGISLIEIVKI